MNSTIVDEIQWPTIEKQWVLGTQLLRFQGYIGFINGHSSKHVSSKTIQPIEVDLMGEKNLLFLNNIVVLNH
jgi:hypothetical protein